MNQSDFSKSYSLRQLAEMTESQLVIHNDCLIEGVANIYDANPTQATFLDNPVYQKIMASCNAGVIIIHPTTPIIEGKNFLLHPSPTLAFQKIVEHFATPSETGFRGIHSKSVIHPSASLADDVQVGPNAVIDQGAVIGKGTIIAAGVFVGANVQIGADCKLYPNVVIREDCKIGDRVTVQPGAVIGSSGFGYFTDKKGKHHPLKQVGNVILEDDVEIGANTTIDRARFQSTIIKKGSKIDNLVQIAHQVEIGEDNLIVSQVGIAGSTKTGSRVIIGGQVGVAGHIQITDDVMLAARAAVSKSLNEKGIYSGAPAAPIKEFNRHFAKLRSIDRVIAKLDALEERVADLTLKNSK